MRLMKRFLLLAFVTAIFSPALGCAPAVGASAADNKRQYKRTMLYDKQMLVDDFTLATLTHRPLRTTRWVLD